MATKSRNLFVCVLSCFISFRPVGAVQSTRLSGVLPAQPLYTHTQHFSFVLLLLDNVRANYIARMAQQFSFCFDFLELFQISAKKDLGGVNKRRQWKYSLSRAGPVDVKLFSK